MDTSLALIVVKIMFMTFIVSWIGIMVILDNKILNKTVVNDVRVRALVTGAGAITFMAFIVSLSFRLQSDGGTGLGAIARATAQVSSYFFFFVAGAIIGARVMRLACKGCEIRLSDTVSLFKFVAISFVAIAVCALLQKYYGPARPDSIWSMIQSILSDIVAQSFIYGGEVFLILFIVIDSGTGVAIHDGWRADEFSYLEKLQSKANLYLLLATLPLIVVPVLLHSRYPLSLFVFGLAYFGVRAVLYQTRIGHHLMRPVTSLAFRYGMKGSNFAQK